MGKFFNWLLAKLVCNLVEEEKEEEKFYSYYCFEKVEDITEGENNVTRNESKE